MPWMSRLAAGFPFAFMRAATRALLAGQSVGRRWFGGVGGVPLAQCQLPLQIGDLLIAFGDLSVALSDLTSEILNLSPQPLIIPLQLILADCAGAAFALIHYSGYRFRVQRDLNHRPGRRLLLPAPVVGLLASLHPRTLCPSTP